MRVQVVVFVDHEPSRGLIEIPDGLVCRYCKKEAIDGDFAMYDSAVPAIFSFVHYDCASVGEALKERVKILHKKMMYAMTPDGKIYRATIGSVLPKGWILLT